MDVSGAVAFSLPMAAKPLIARTVMAVPAGGPLTRSSQVSSSTREFQSAIAGSTIWPTGAPCFFDNSAKHWSLVTGVELDQRL